MPHKRSVRAVNAANVASKMAKVARELDSVNEQQNKIKLEKDIQYITAELRDKPELVETVLNVLKIGTTGGDSKANKLSPGVEGRSLERLPVHFLKVLLPALGVGIEVLRRHGSDHGSLLQLLLRLTLSSGLGNIFSIRKDELTKYFQGRAEKFQQYKAVILAAHTKPLDWTEFGVYTLHPPLLDEKSVRSHKYTHIECYGYRTAIQNFIVTPEWEIIRNYDIGKAALAHPAFSVQPLCIDFFQDLNMDKLVDEHTRWLPSDSSSYTDSMAPPDLTKIKRCPGATSASEPSSKTRETMQKEEELSIEGSGLMDIRKENGANPPVELEEPAPQSHEAANEDSGDHNHDTNEDGEEEKQQEQPPEPPCQNEDVHVQGEPSERGKACALGAVAKHPSCGIPPLGAPPKKQEAAMQSLAG